MLEISVELALVRDSDCCVYAANMHGFGGGGLGSNQTVAGLKQQKKKYTKAVEKGSNQTVAGLKPVSRTVSLDDAGGSNQTVAGLKLVL